MRRRIVGIAIAPASEYNEGVIVAVADDGTAWTERLAAARRQGWQRLQELPDAPDAPDAPPGSGPWAR